MSEHRSQAALCQEVETELRELCQECRKKFPIIKEYTERAILKIRCHHEQVEKAARASTAPGAQAAAAPEFPLDEVLRAILMACETFQCKIVLLSLSCLQRLIHRRVLKDETVAIVINLMKEQAAHGDESVQLKVLQTIMATPAHMTLLNELVVEQLMQLLHVLHNSSAPSVHHTACAGLRQLVEFMSDRAAAALAEASAQAEAPKLDGIKPVIRARATALPSVSPSQPPPSLPPAVRMFVIFVQDLCVMADYDPSSFSMRYAVDAGERLRSASREGYWLATVKFPRPLCLELLGVCVASHPAIFASSPECFQLLRHNICAALLKNLQSCYDFAILIRSVHLLQQITRAPGVAALLMHEVQIFLHLMLDLTSAERSPWQRATSLEFLKSVCEDPAMLTLLYEHGNSGSADAERERRSSAPGAPSGSPHVGSGPRTFLELVNSLSKLIHQVCFSAGTDSGSLLQSAPAAASALPPGGPQRAQSGDVGRGLLTGNFPGLLSLGTGGAGSGTRDMLGGAGAPAADGAARPLGKDGGAGAGAAGSSDQRRRRGGKLLLMMSDTEPPAVPPALLVSLVVESVLSIVSTLYRLLLDAVPPDAPVQDAGVPVTPLGALRAALPCPSGEAGGDAPTEAPSRHSTPLSGVLTFEQQQVQAMLGDSWASLLSALSLLMHGIMDEQCLQQALRCMQTLLFCCSRLALDQARDACLLQLSRYALPGPGHEAEAEAAAAGCMVGGGLTVKNVLCFKALLHFCCLFGRLLGSAGWSIVLHAFNGLERALGKVPRAQSELTVLRQALDALFETTAVLDREALGDIIEAMGQTMKGTSDGQPGQSGPKGGPPADGDEGAVVLERLVELCSFNLGRLVQIWAHVLRVISDVCMSEERGELRGAAAAALCRILAQALRKGALALEPAPEEAQDELLRSLEALLCAPQEETRARVCEGLLSILQASGQELYPAAWGTIIRLVATGARVELERVGVQFFLPTALDPLAAAAEDGADGSAVQHQSFVVVAAEGRESSTVLPQLFQLLELLVHDFMEHVPLAAVPRLTGSIGAFARFGGLGVNSSLTAVGFLWKVADFLAGPVGVAAAGVASAGSASIPAAPAGGLLEELWVQLFMHLRVLAVDGRPEVRNCAVKSLTSALFAHGRKVGVACYKRCLQDILIEVLSEIQEQGRLARSSKGVGGASGLLVHHSRDTPEKQWDETTVLAVEGVRRVLSNFAEEAGDVEFAPLAYVFLLQVQSSLRALSPEVSGTALRALVDLMRVPASSHEFDSDVLTISAALPVPAKGKTSVWLLCWDVLWGMVGFCLTHEVPEALIEMFASTLSSLRNSHHQLFTPVQHVALLQLSLVLATDPSFYLPSSAPLLSAGAAEGRGPAHAEALAAAAAACAEAGSAEVAGAHDEEIFAFAGAAPDILWKVEGRRPAGAAASSYAKAPVAVSCYVEANQNRNLDVRSVEFALRSLEQPPGAPGAEGDAARPDEEVVQTFLGTTQSPTHRTMLHVSAPRVQHVQGFALGLLEEAQGFPQPALEVFFLYMLCSVFLDARRVLLDTNKVALAARAMCLLVLFCRRVVLHNLCRLGTAACRGRADAVAHLEALLAVSLPHVLRSLMALARSDGPSGLREAGLWKLALETAVYLVDDSLPAVERGEVSKKTCAAYWAAVSEVLGAAVKSALHEPEAAAAAAPGAAPLLVEALGGLCAQRALPCATVPAEVSERVVGLLGELDAAGGRLGAGRGALGHLFDLCSRPQEAPAGAGPAAEGVGDGRAFGAAALAARGGAPARLPPRLPGRGALLAAAMPALLARLRTLFATFAEDEASAGPDGPPAHAAEDVAQALARLAAAELDPAALAELSPSAAAKAKAACELAGPRGLTLTLLPQLARLAASADPGVRRGVSGALRGLSTELEL